VKPSALVLSIVGKGKGSGPDAPSDYPEKEEGAPESSLNGMAALSAAKDVLAAIKANDASALNAALKAHAECCMGDDEE